MSSRRVGMAALALLVPVAAKAQAQGIDTIFHRPVDISLTISNSKQYGGTYVASGIGRYCGNVALNMTGNTKQFGMEFPFEGVYEIRDLTFTADTLLSGTTTDKYHLVVSLKTKDGGTPPNWVLRTDEPRYKETGTANLTVTGGIARLKIEGQNTFAERIDMTIVCKPKGR